MSPFGIQTLEEAQAYAKGYREEYGGDDTTEQAMVDALVLDFDLDSDPLEKVEKNCGTGSTGFEAGNTCAAGDGSGKGGKGGKASGKGGKSTKVDTKAGHKIEVVVERDKSLQALIDDDEDEKNGIAITHEAAVKMQETDEIKDGSIQRDVVDAYLSNGYSMFTEQVGTQFTPMRALEEIVAEFGTGYGTIDSEAALQLQQQGSDKAERDILAEKESGKAGKYFRASHFALPKEKFDEMARIILEGAKLDEEIAVRQKVSESVKAAMPKIKEDLEISVARSRLGCCVRLMRGISIEPRALNAMIKEGVISHQGLNSWSTSKEIATHFMREEGAVLVMRKPAVGWVVKTEGKSKGGESEVIRPPSSLRIVRVTKTKNKQTLIEVEEDEDYA